MGVGMMEGAAFLSPKPGNRGKAVFQLARALKKKISLSLVMYICPKRRAGFSSPGCSTVLLGSFVAIIPLPSPPSNSPSPPRPALIHTYTNYTNTPKKQKQKQRRLGTQEEMPIVQNKVGGKGYLSERREAKTYNIQPSAGQDSLRRSRYTTPIPLQIPHNFPTAKLGKHGLDQVDLCGVGPAAMVQTAGRLLSPTRGREKEVAESEEEEDEDEK